MSLFTRLTAAALFSICLFSSNAWAQEKLTPVAFDPSVLCTQRIIQDRITDFYANKKLMGLNQYAPDGTLLHENAGGDKLKFDYVPGLVAKAIIEAADYYQDRDFARSWFYSVQDYANRYFDGVPTVGKSLDDLNATKMYFALYDLTDPKTGAFRDIADPKTHSNAEQAMKSALKGLRDTKENYVITPEVSEEAAGGWWHKGTYPHQMWCDGQYMGPALLAQLIHYGYTIDGVEEDWKTIARQFEITWNKLWVPEERLLKHAFSADPLGEKANSWADPKTGVSKEYWGRACGWYFMALIDVLELMPEDNPYRPQMVSYLLRLADGLAARRDAKTGCWYQLLAHDGNFEATVYQGVPYPAVKNYFESSATCLFTAGFLKGMRLGLLPEAYRPMAEASYLGLFRQFVRQRPDGTWMLIDDCASAGLGGANWGGRDGSAEYYLLGSDVTRITDYTEGKVYGAFILAATEYERSKAAK